MQKQPYTINGSILVRPSTNEIIFGSENRHSKKTEKLEPRIMLVLNMLAVNEGKVVTRQSLIETIWENEFVGEDALTQAISRLRKILADNPRSPQIIETIPKKGYRFVGRVGQEKQPESAGRESKKQWRNSYTRNLLLLPVALFFCLAIITAISFKGTKTPSLSTGLVQFTSDQGRENYPAISPNNDFIVFSKQTPDERAMNLYVKSRHSNLSRRLTHSPSDDLNATWSPDGKFIAYLRLIDGKSTIYILPFNHENPKNPGQELLQTDFTNSSNLSWSPDGTHILFSDKLDSQKNLQLFTLDVSTGKKSPLLNAVDDNYDYINGVYSRDGKHIAYSKRRNLADIICTVTMAKDNPLEREVHHFPGAINDIAWYDSQSLIFKGYKENQSSLWNVALSDGKLVWLGGEQVSSFAYLQDSNELVYANRYYNIDLHQVLLPEEAHIAPKTVFSSTKSEWAPDLSPDQQSLIFLSNKTGQYQLWQADLVSGRSKQLTFFRNAVAANARWSPDGERIVVEVLEEGNYNLYLLDITGGKPVLLLKDGFDNENPSWSADGENIYYQSNRSGQEDIWRINVSSGLTEQMTTDGAIYGEASPDGKYLYFTRAADETGLWRLDLEKRGAAEKIYSLPCQPQANAWRLSDNGLFFKLAHEDRFSIAHYNFSSGEIEILHSIEDFVVDATIMFTISPDRRLLFYSNLIEIESDLVLAGIK